MNCTDFVSFDTAEHSTLLVGGGDIAVAAKYYFQGDTIRFKELEGANFSISFIYEDKQNLKRIEDGTVWVKSQNN